MIRMEIACFLVLGFMAIMYFSAEREKTRIHRVFSFLLILSMAHLLLDGITIYTVNHLEMVPKWFNNLVHRLFIGTMEAIFYFIYSYVVLLIEDDEAKGRLRVSRYAVIPLVISLLGVVFLPLYYVETPKGNYSYGPAAFTTYACIGIYLFITIFTLFRHWKNFHAKKKMAVGVALGIELFVLIYQALYPLALISGMGIMLAILAFYLTLENPDIFLVEQVKKEKQKADEANAAKSTFLSQMSHEIRTPMNAVVGMAEILLRTDLTDEQREYMTNIQSSGNALVSIINDILDISKIEAGKMELVEDVYELSPIISDIRMIIQNRIGDKPIAFVCEVDENLPHRLYGDGLRIRQVIINLLNNAVKFTDEGQVKLTVKEMARTEAEVQLFVAVSDTGQGIREEDLTRLFGAFEQVDTKRNKGKEGTGLGLTISSQFIRLMGGKLEVRSEYGVGSEFFFTISQKIVTEVIEKQEETEADATNFVAPDARILVVDDIEMNLKVAVGLLAPLQMQIDVALSGQKALDMIREKQYHMVLMDHMMPVMDGVETTRQLRQMEGSYYRELPVIALTASAMKSEQQLFYDVGMNGFVAKPIDMRMLTAAIRKWLPEELVIKQELGAADTLDKAKSDDDANWPRVQGIDLVEAKKNTGNYEFFISLLGDFYKIIDVKADKIAACVEEHLIRDYTIEVHALKSMARMIGAVDLSERFRQLEEFGKAEDFEAIVRETPEVLSLYRSYQSILEPYGVSDDSDKRDASTEEIILYLKEMQDAMEDLDIDAADEAMKRLEECRLPDACQSLMDRLRAHVADLAMKEVLEITSEMISILT